LRKNFKKNPATLVFIGLYFSAGIAVLPKKKTKKRPLTKTDKKENQALASNRVMNENVIGVIKRFKIISDRYRNRRKRFGLRVNLIAGIYNWELEC
jgi:hypothetical protein